MAAINALVARDLLSRQLAKRQNWAQQETGVIVVFCIVFVGTNPSFLPLSLRHFHFVYIHTVTNSSMFLPWGQLLTLHFTVAVGLIILWIYKCMQKRKAKKETLG
jgi:hypothetical protein